MPQYDVNIRDYWRIVRKRKSIILFAGGMLGLFATIASVISQPAPIYRATSKVRYQISQVNENPLGGRTVSYGSGVEDLDTQKEIITSYEVLERVAIRIGDLDTATTGVTLSRDKKEEKRINAILGLRGSATTETEGNTSIINVSITDGKPQRARDVANAIVEVYKEYSREMANRQATRSREFILSQRNALRDSVTQLEQQIKAFRLRENMMSVEAQTAMVMGRLNVVQEAVKQTQAAIQNVERVINSLQGEGAAAEKTLVTILPDEGGGVFGQLNAQLTDLNVRRNALLIEYTDQHPQVREVDVRKKDVIRDMFQALRSRREALQRQEQNQTTALDAVEKEYQRLPQLGLELSNMEQQLRLKGEMLVFYERSAQEAEIQDKESVQEVEIIQRALLPSAPINPSSPTTTASVGTVLGLILGVVFAFIAETLDTSIGTIEDVEEYLKVSVVGIIPHIDIDEVKESLIRKGVPASDTETLERRSRLAAHFDPQSTLAESYRALRTNIQFVNVERGAKVISITSASSQEGKSITVSNLAMTMAQAGNRVLLVDCDLRRPTIYRTFGLDREPGLTDFILGNYEWRDVVRTVTDIMTGGLGMEDIMMTPGMDNLNIITSGAIPPNPSEITDSRRMNDFIAQAREAYDIVLFDSPPVLQATDATVLGTKVDGVLMVYKIGQVSRGALRRAKLQLDNLNIPVLGIVLNGLRAEVSDDFQDLRYYTYYSYGSEHKERTPREKFLRKFQPALDLLKKSREKVLGWWKGREDLEEKVPEETLLEIEEESDWWRIAVKILLYLLLGSFVLLGLLWQFGYFDPPRQPEPPATPTRRSPSGHPTKPSQTSALLTAYATASDDQDTNRAHPSEVAPSHPSPLISPGEGSRDTASPSGTAAEQQLTASGARSVSLQTGHRFAVQVGAFSDRRRAERLIARLRKAGYDAQAAPGDLTRVLLVGFDSPQAAGGKAHRLRQSGLAPLAAVVELPPDQTAPSGTKWASIDNDAEAPVAARR